VKLLVTGASGFIGRNVLLRAPKDWEIVALYNRTANLDAFVSGNQLAHVRPVQCNLLDEGAVRRLARSIGRKPDAMLYLAANGDPAASSESPRWDLESNTVALVTCLEHCPAEHVVYVSSGAVYDGLKGAVTPATSVSPLLPYAISKLASERYLTFFADHRHAVGSYFNVRFFGAYGPYEAARKITTKWLKAMAGGQREFTVRGDGENLIDFMYVDDAIDGFLALVGARGQSGTVDFASGAPVSVNAVVESMARVLGATVTVKHEGIVPEYIQFQSADTTMRDRFGIKPSVTFEDGLTRLSAFLKNA
jgi:UDP-glucose 4-epimerase